MERPGWSARPLNTALSVILLALGVATIVLLLLVVGQAEERMHRDARGIDLVVGAKGGYAGRDGRLADPSKLG